LHSVKEANHLTRKIHLILNFLAVLVFSFQAQAAPARVAILGDSITFDGRWATRVEAALRSSPDFAKAEIVNFGLGSETVSGLSEPNHADGKFPRPCLFERLDRVLDAYQPTLVLACYGMNDGIYLPPDALRFRAFRDGIEKLKTSVEKRGAKIIFITPSLHDADHPSKDPNRYDLVLEHYRYYLASRPTPAWQVIDIRPDLRQAIAAEKAGDPEFVFAKDKVHPGEQGHRLIADSIIRQLWPILKLPGAPNIPSDEALAILSRRAELLKLAWLTQTRHTRPGVPAGLPLDQANTEAAELMKSYLNGATAASAVSGRSD
jgi:lysophospholipase L1-like esterase